MGGNIACPKDGPVESGSQRLKSLKGKKAAPEEADGGRACWNSDTAQ